MSAPDTPTNALVQFLPHRVRRSMAYWAAGVAAYRGANRVINWHKSRVEHTVVVGSSDKLFGPVQDYLFDLVPKSEQRSLKVSSNKNDGIRLRYDDDGKNHKIVLDGHTITVMYQVKDRAVNDGDSDRASTVGMALMGYDDSKITFVAKSQDGKDAVIRLMVTLAEDIKNGNRKPTLRVGTKWGSFRYLTDSAPRPMETVIMPGDVAENLLHDLQTFLTSEEDYAEAGIPWHRAYLFDGPPGSGKTSIARALATECGLDVYWIPLGDVSNDSTLIQMIGEIDSKSVLILEDIDVMHAARERTDDEPGVTMQGLLNALDGFVTPHGLITMMTTNEIGVLDEALLRRADVAQHVPALDSSDLERLIEQFCGQHIPVQSHVKSVANNVINIVKTNMADKEAMTAEIKRWVDQVEREQYR